MRIILILMTILVIGLAASNAGSASLVSLAYDDGVNEGALWLGGQTGHAVIFTAPVDNWSLSQVNILGMLNENDTSGTFAVEVWDQNLGLLYRTSDRASAYFSGDMKWAQVDLPDIVVSGEFLICVFEYGGVFLGFDAGESTGRSALVSRNPNYIMNWSVENHTRNQTDWMIRASGHSPEPDFEVRVLSGSASEKSPAIVDVEAEDPDGNLESVTLFIMDNTTREIVWSESREIEGGKAESKLSWPAATFSISDGIEDLGPIYAVSNGRAAENVSHLIAYYAPCITEVRENQTISTRAYFGEDGSLNALVDSSEMALYISEDLMDATDPDADYAGVWKNMTIVPDMSKIAFLRMSAPGGDNNGSTEPVGPLLLSGTASSGFDIELEKISAGSGEYVAIVKVMDGAYNEVTRIGDRIINVDRA